MTGTLVAHPYADQWRLLEGEDFDALRDDIAANGLREAITLYDGQIVDGRNRFSACVEAGVVPHFREFEGTDDDLLAFIESVNAYRRHDTPSAIAASRALMWEKAGRRKDGRWKRDTVRSANGQLSISAGEVKAFNRSGLILDHLGREALEQVRDGQRSLNDAYTAAEQSRVEREVALEQAQRRHEQEVADEMFLQERAPDFAEQVGTTYRSHGEALAVWRVRFAEEAKKLAEEERKARKDQEDLERGWKDTCSRIGECVYSLDGGDNYGATFLREFYPHEADLIHPSMRLTRDRVDGAIKFLTTIREGITK